MGTQKYTWSSAMQRASFLLLCGALVQSVSGSFLTRTLGHAQRSFCAGRASIVSAAVTSDEVSFVQTEMRGAAMKLHTRDQARQGERPAQKPVMGLLHNSASPTSCVQSPPAPLQVTTWEPGRAEYLQFLVDSQLVYGCFEDIVMANDVLAPFRDSGLERRDALALDIAWFAEEGLPTPSPAKQGLSYEAFLRDMVADERWEQFVCHF